MTIENKRENNQRVFAKLYYGDCFSMDENTDFLAIKIEPIKECNAVRLYNGAPFMVNQDEKVFLFNNAKIVIE